MSNTKNMWLLIASLMVFGGCASFKGGDLPEIKFLPPRPVSSFQPTATYQFASSFEFFDKVQHTGSAKRGLETEFAQILKESGYFENVKSKKFGRTDLSITIQLAKRASWIGLIPSTFTFASLYIIPSWITSDIEVVAKVTSSSGVEKDYQLSGTSTRVQWLPMILFSFSDNQPQVESEARKNIYKNLIFQMEKDGLLKKP